MPCHQPPTAPALNTLASLQAQLSETQSTLAAPVGKICALERLSELGGLAREHEAIKHEVRMLRNMIGKGREAEWEEEAGSEGDEDETRSVAIVTVGDDGDAREERGAC